LRDDPAYPGAGCDDAKLRTFRQLLLSRPTGEPGAELKGSLDFYSASGFRDLVLHVSEQGLTIPQIETFLQENGLVFRGFRASGLFAFLQDSFPDEKWPGSREAWAKLEAVNPYTFSRMYQFWCERT
jgi:hypothetical protein